MKDNTNELIAKANQKLKESINAGIRIERNKSSLYLRGMLPPKPNSKVTIFTQQRISLSRLGIRANPCGVREAEKEAIKIYGLLARNEFTWEPYLKTQFICQTVSDWVKELEKDYFSKTERDAKTETTWQDDYLQPFNCLPQQEKLTLELLKTTILATRPNSKSRRRWTLALRKLGKFAGLNCDSLDELIGNYSPAKVAPKEIPSDELIVQSQSLLSHESWLWAYRMLATYGLRNHEIFYIDFSEFPILKVKGGKTGPRIVWPLFYEWAIDWNLKDEKLPNWSGKNNSDRGRRMTCLFNKRGVPFTPLDLRHAWAIRSLEFGMDISLAAQQMGHSVKVHSESYHRWITKDVHERAYQVLLKNPDRPRPPGYVA